MIREFDLQHLVEDAAFECAELAKESNHAIVGFMEPQVARLYVADDERLKGILVSIAKSVMKLDNEMDVCIRATNGNVFQDNWTGRVPLRFAVHYPYVGGRLDGIENIEQEVRDLGSQLIFGIEKGKGSFTYFNLDIQASVNQIDRPLYAEELKSIPLFVLSNEPPPNRAIHANLRFWGLRCDGAPTFQEGILEISRQATLEDPYKLIIVSQPIEDSSATDVAREVRSSALSVANLIHIDRFYSKQNEQASFDAGFDFYMAKPFRTAELLNAISKLLSVELRPERNIHMPPVLIVEDNLTNQKLAMYQLRTLGITADISPNGVEALSALDRKKYALVLMDLQMPVMSGFEAIAKIRAQTRFKDLPIVALTSHDDFEARLKCKAAGANDFFTKPIGADTMRRIVQTWCPGCLGVSNAASQSA